MKFILFRFGLFVSVVILLSREAHALDLSQSVPLERYTIIDDNALEDADGYLLGNGAFRVITSSEMGYEGFSEETFVPISGRPIMEEDAYEEYKDSGLIPRWVRSRDDFYIGLFPYVIVSVAGGIDPNPSISIETQPENQIALLGFIVTFSVAASPIEYVSYQWLFDGKPIPGQNASFLSVDVEKAAQAGNYSVELNTGGKNIVSKKAGLKIIVPVAVTTEPKSQTIKVGRAVVFRVAAKGTGPYTYQWYFNGSPIPKATKSFYSIGKTEQGDAGQYFVAVSNELSFATSVAATCSIVP